MALLLSGCRAGVWAEAEVAKFVPEEDPLSLQTLVSAGWGHPPDLNICMWSFYSFDVCLFFEQWLRLKLASHRCWCRRSRRPACSSPQGLVSGPSSCLQRADHRALRGTSRTAPSFPPAPQTTSSKRSNTFMFFLLINFYDCLQVEAQCKHYFELLVPVWVFMFSFYKCLIRVDVLII